MLDVEDRIIKLLGEMARDGQPTAHADVCKEMVARGIVTGGTRGMKVLDTLCCKRRIVVAPTGIEVCDGV